MKINGGVDNTTDVVHWFGQVAIVLDQGRSIVKCLGLKNVKDGKRIIEKRENLILPLNYTKSSVALSLFVWLLVTTFSGKKKNFLT